MITKKEINEKYNGVFTFEHTDSFGTLFRLSIFTIGNVVTVRVYRGDALVFHRESISYRKFSYAVRCFDGTKEWIVNEDEHRSMHEHFGAEHHATYPAIKKTVEEWIAKYKRPMNIADAQALAKPYKNRSQALDMVYTAACALAHDPKNCAFRERYNFSVQFSV